MTTPSLRLSSVQDVIVGLQRISAILPNGTENVLLSTGILTTIDTAVSELWLPTPICDAFASAFGLTYFEPADRYALTNAAYSALQAAPPIFKFTIGGAASGGETIVIEIPWKAFDLKASYPIFANSTNYFPLRRAANDSQMALGRAFLQEVYLSVDWERDEFNISQAVFKAPMPEPSIVTILPKEGPGDTLIPFPSPQPSVRKLSPGAIAGITIGCLLLVILLICAGWWFWRRRQRANAEAEATSTLPVGEKKDAGDSRPDGMGDMPKDSKDEPRTDLELEARAVAEMYAPHGASEVHYGSPVREVNTEAVEADGTSPIYELPSPIEIRR